MNDYLLFTFNLDGCTIAILHDGTMQVLAQLSPYSCLHLGIPPNRLTGYMHYGTELQFPLREQAEEAKTPIPPGILKAFGEGDTL